MGIEGGTAALASIISYGLAGKDTMDKGDAMSVMRISGIAVGALAMVLGAATAQANAAAHPKAAPIVIDSSSAGGYGSVLTYQPDEPVSAATASRIKASLGRGITSAVPDAGPTGGEFLLCNKTHTFTDFNGKFTFQHACYGKTGTWGYQISEADCATDIAPFKAVKEKGMAWTRNGKRMSPNSGHNVDCGYQFHGTFNPENDFDLIAYVDIFTWPVDIPGGRGTATLTIHGSFYSAVCTNPSVCPGVVH